MHTIRDEEQTAHEKFNNTFVSSAKANKRRQQPQRVT